MLRPIDCGRGRGPRSQRCHESQASPLASRTPEAGSCSKAHQSEFVLPPSIWCAAVAAPNRKSCGEPRAAHRDDATWRSRPAPAENGPMPSDLDELVGLLDLEQIEVNIFRGTQPDEERQRVFGGQVAAQALVAAGRTVDDGVVHSLHSYFLRPGDPEHPDPLRGRPDPRRAELHDAPRGRDPARPARSSTCRRRSIGPRRGFEHAVRHARRARPRGAPDVRERSLEPPRASPSSSARRHPIDHALHRRAAVDAARLARALQAAVDPRGRRARRRPAPARLRRRPTRRT